MTLETLVYAWVFVPALLFAAFLCIIVPGAVVVFVGDRLAAMARRYEADEAAARREADEAAAEMRAHFGIRYESDEARS